MSPEIYTIIGGGVGLASLMVGIAGLLLYNISSTNRRIDRLEIQFVQRIDQLEDRMDRLEDKFDQLLERVHSLDLWVSKLEWMLEAALYGKPVRIPPESDNGDAT